MNSTEEISVTLPADMVRLIRERVSSGAYASTSEIVGEAVRLWQAHSREHDDQVAAIKARIQRSLADPRPSAPVEEVFDRLERLHTERIKASGDDL
jgi:antitoxin ParD1/3/4